MCTLTGVYQYTTGSYVGGHAVKIIGWGTENGTDYWLVSNSWNPSWGMEGFFKFIRGTNDCTFELEMVGGYPDTSSWWSKQQSFLILKSFTYSWVPNKPYDIYHHFYFLCLPFIRVDETVTDQYKLLYLSRVWLSNGILAES